LDNAKSEFISIASHQLRTPLTAIKGYTSLMLEGSYGKIDNQIQDVINKVYSANNRLIDLVENLLSISRLESGRMQYNFQLTQLADIVQDTISMFAVIAKKQNTELIVVTPEMPLPLMSLDAGKIREVISNLVENALKYTSQNGSVTVKMEQVDDEKVRLSIKDTGIGIHKEDLEHIFLKFARSKETEKLYVGGTGLGLYVGRTFIEKHGGRLWAESVGPGQGSEFICELPISRDSV
jgi:signal transduction histidine kinase